METENWQIEDNSKKKKSELPIHFYVMERLLIALSIVTMATFFAMIVIF